MIKLSNLEIGYKSKQQRKSVYNNLNLEYKLGDFVGIIGNNGVGKSTLLKTITASIQPLSGDVFIDNKNSLAFSSNELAQLISVVITEKIGGFNLTVWDVVSAGRIPYINIFAKLTSEDINITEQSLKTLDIEHLKNSLIDELSDGQRQKVMIAKSLAQCTPIIILDEPTAFLDYNSKHHLFKVLKNFCETQNKLILVSSHDLDLMKKYVTKTLEMF